MCGLPLPRPIVIMSARKIFADLLNPSLPIFFALCLPAVQVGTFGEADLCSMCIPTLWHRWGENFFRKLGNGISRSEAITTAMHSLCMLLCPNQGNLYQILQWCLRIGAKFSLHQISPFQISQVPNPPRGIHNEGCGIPLILLPLPGGWATFFSHHPSPTRGGKILGRDNFMGKFLLYGRWRNFPLAKFRGVSSAVKMSMALHSVGP